MLAMQPANRIGAAQASGLHRREEVELTQFEKPVLDIERTSRLKLGTVSVAGMADISEDFGGPVVAGSGKYLDIGAYKS